MKAQKIFTKEFNSLGDAKSFGEKAMAKKNVRLYSVHPKGLPVRNEDDIDVTVFVLLYVHTGEILESDLD